MVLLARKHYFSGVMRNKVNILLDNPYLGTLITSAGDDRRTDLQVFRQFSDWLLQEKCHEKKIECRNISVLRKKGLKDRKAGKMTRVSVNFPDRRSATGTPANIKS